MNSRVNNLRPTRSWQHGRPVAGSYAPYRSTITATGATSPLWSLQDRELAMPSYLASFQGTSQSPARILVFHSDMPRDENPRPIFTSESPGGDSILTLEEQKKSLEKLRKEVYNPALQRLNLYYRDYNPRKNLGVEDGKRCAICLDDFEPRKVVTLTPCNHMFHDDCIVPWVRSHGKCPVCRSAIGEQSRDNRVPTSTTNTNFGNDPFTRELISFVRATEARSQIQF